MLRRHHFATHLLNLGPKLFLFHFLFFPPATTQMFSGKREYTQVNVVQSGHCQFLKEKKSLLLLSYKHLPQKEGGISYEEREDGTITGILYFLVSLYCEHYGAGRMQASQFKIFLNAEGSEFQIQPDLFSLWILSPAVITSLLDSKGERRSTAPQTELVWHQVKMNRKTKH